MLIQKVPRIIVVSGILEIFMDWATRRKFLYSISLLVFCSISSLYFLKDYIFKSPTCFDGKRNGYEIGVDCGGTCSLKCVQEVTPLTSLWAQSIMTSSSTYDLVGMVSNKNIDNASRYLDYTFTVFGDAGSVLAVFNGRTSAPIDGDFPITMQNVHISGAPVSTLLELHDQPHYSVPARPSVPTLNITGIRYEGGNVTRVYAIVKNTKQVVLNTIPVKVILFDINDNAYAIGDTIIPHLDKEGVEDISFVWPYGFKNNPTKIRIYPILDPFVRQE